MADQRILQSALFTNDAGLVIFGDSEFRQLINLPTPFKLVWRTLDDVLGISREFADTILDRSAQGGRFELAQLQIRRREDAQQNVLLESHAAFDSDGKFAGLNLTLQHADGNALWRAASVSSETLSESEHDILRSYFLKQVTVLQDTMDAFGGQRFRHNLNTVIGSSATLYQWPAQVRDRELVIEAEMLPVSAYRGLLARGIAYARSVLGLHFLAEKMAVIDAQLPESDYALITRSGMRELYEDM